MEKAHLVTSIEELRQTRGTANELISLVASDELERRIKNGWDQWCDLVDDLVATGGTLPSKELAGRLLRFFEDAYWRAEQAHEEVLQRELGPGTPARRTSTTLRSPGLSF